MKTFHILFLFVCMSLASAVHAQSKPNILFLSIDDLKPALGSYGYEGIQTPQIDRLASRGAIMLNNHCQQAVCAPSRMSMFSGLRPDVTGVRDLRTHLVESNPDAVTMQQHFKANGYQTAGAGKIMHGSDPTHTHPESWTVPYTKKNDLPYAEGFPVPAYGFYQGKDIQAAYKQMLDEGVTHWRKQRDYMTERNAMPAVESLDVPDDAYMDGALAVWAMDQLQDFKASGEPFFLTVGFGKPHLPFVAPKKYWDLYPAEKTELAEFRQRGENAPDLAFHTFGELRSYSDIDRSASIDNPLNPAQQKELIRGYYACVSYVDAQVGLVLDKLEELGLDENTVVVLWGDHGYHLGDHGLWNKHSNFEQATRSPLIFTAPGFKGGARVSSPTEFVDIFPTLLDLAGLEAPYEMAGESLVPAMKNPDHRVKEFAVSQYTRGKDIMGYALRNDRYRLVHWMRGGWDSTLPYREDLLEAVELYDYEEDPLETVNQAANPEYADIRNGLEKDLLAFFEDQEKEVVTENLAAQTPGKEGELLDLSAVDPSSVSMRFASVEKSDDGNALVLNFEHSPKWPSVEFSAPNEGVWDLSGTGSMKVLLKNESEEAVKTVAYIALPEDSNANRKRYGNMVTLQPGVEGIIPIGFDGTLDASRMQKLRIFVNKTKGPVRMTLTGITLDGNMKQNTAERPAVTEKEPAPAADWMDLSKAEDLNTRFRFSALKQVEDGVQIEYELSPKWPSVDFMPPEDGVWDLSDYKSVQFTLTNTGDSKARILGFFTNEGDTQQDQKRSTGFKKDLQPGESATAYINLSPKDNFDPARITSMKLFTGMHTAPVQVTVKDLKRNK